MSTPVENSGAFSVESAGWVRVGLANDAAEEITTDIWCLPGRVYPLRVTRYDLPGSTAASGINFLSNDLGGYTRSHSYDEGESFGVTPGNLGFYAGGSGEIIVDGETRVVTIGDFYAGEVSSITFVGFAFISVIWP